jgi:hypothetical protein
MHAAPADESFSIIDSEQVKEIWAQYGTDDFPGLIPEDGGLFFRGVSTHPTHWLVFIYIATSRDVDASDWRLYGFPKAKYDRQVAEWIMCETSAEFGLKGPFFS